jgi:hypothetical protein
MIEIREKDLLPVAETVIRRGSNIVDLAAEGAIGVTFTMRNRYDSASKIDEAAAAIFDGPNGVLRYTWVAADTDTPGVYYADWTVTFPGGPESFPTRASDIVIIHPRVKQP